MNAPSEVKPGDAAGGAGGGLSSSSSSSSGMAGSDGNMMCQPGSQSSCYDGSPDKHYRSQLMMR